MKTTALPDLSEPYSLHDMNVVELEVLDDDLILRTQSGILRIGQPSAQVDGYVQLQDVDWGKSFALVYDNYDGNIGPFSGRKLYLADFIREFSKLGSLNILETGYAPSQVRYTGFLHNGHTVGLCTLEICYLGQMLFREQSDPDRREMKEVILSSDGDLSLYRVPADVADDLVRYCIDFAVNYVWHGPKNSKFLRLMGQQYVAFYTEEDFIDYLNEEKFPQLVSAKIKTLGSFEDGVPDQYASIPRFNF